MPIARRPRLAAVPLIVALAAAQVSVAPFVYAADDAATDAKKKEARAHYDKGVQLYDEQAYEAALVEFQRAYDILPNWRLLFNIGQIYYQTNDFAAALTNLQQYVHDGGAEVPVDRKAEVDKLIGQMKERVATITVKVDLPGATVKIDDRVVGTSPLAAPITVNIGYRRISATRDGRTDSSVVTVAGTDNAVVELHVAAPIDNTPKAEKTKPTFPVVPWVITGAFVAGAAVTGFLALGAQKDLKNDRSDPNATRSSLDSALSKEKTLAITTDILTVGAVAAAAVSVYFTVKYSKDKKAYADTGSLEEGAVRVGFGPGSISLAGAF